MFKDNGRAFREGAEWAMERLATKWSVGGKIRMLGANGFDIIYMYVQSKINLLSHANTVFWDGDGREAAKRRFLIRAAPDSVRTKTGGTRVKDV